MSLEYCRVVFEVLEDEKTMICGLDLIYKKVCYRWLCRRNVYSSAVFTCGSTALHSNFI